MRLEPLPLLSHLPPGLTVQRCERCGCLALQREICANEQEAAHCMGRNGSPKGVERN